MADQQVVIYQLLKVFEKPEFKNFYKELIQDEMVCDTCYPANENYSLLIRYQFIQQIAATSLINISIFTQELSIFGTCIDITYNLKGNENIVAEITYPLQYTEQIPICNYYTVFWCNPGVWKNKPPVIIIDIMSNGESFRLKGKIQKMNFLGSDSISYRIKLTNCNCFLEKVLQLEEISARLTIIPEKLVDSFGSLRSNNTCANKFTI